MIKKWEKINLKIYGYNNFRKISFNLSMYFPSPIKWSLQGIQIPSQSPRFTIFPVTSTLQEFSLLPQRKNEIVFANRLVFHFDKCPTTASHFSNLFSGSN